MILKVIGSFPVTLVASAISLLNAYLFMKSMTILSMSEIRGRMGVMTLFVICMCLAAYFGTTTLRFIINMILMIIMINFGGKM